MKIRANRADLTKTRNAHKMPVCLCLDTSSFVSRRAIEELNAAMKFFQDMLKSDDIAKSSVELAVITFTNGDSQCLRYFSEPVSKSLPRLSAEGLTFMGEAMNLAADLINNRIDAYLEAGIEYYKPWVLMILAGTPNGNEAALKISFERIRGMVTDGELEIFPIAASDGADLQILQSFSPLRKALKLYGYDFKGLFRWFGENILRALTINPGEAVKLTRPDWCEF